MTREEAIERFEKQLTAAMVVLDSGFGTRPGESDRLYRQRKEMAEWALSALRAQQEREKIQPLTLEELRGMDGEPVWIVEYPDWGHWELSVDAEDYLTEREPAFYGMKHDDPMGRYGLHKLGWLAYRRKPEEISSVYAAGGCCCRECDNWDEEEAGGHVSLGNLTAPCSEWSDIENGYWRYTKPTDFCSYGRRREGADD